MYFIVFIFKQNNESPRTWLDKKYYYNYYQIKIAFIWP